MYNCIQLMEHKPGNVCDLDLIPVLYTEEINTFDIHIRITKE